jgi:hypothetical protein
LINCFSFFFQLGMNTGDDGLLFLLITKQNSQ